MNGLPYYKAYPRDFVEGTIGMDFELKGAYRLVLDLIYMQGGNLPDDARYISGLLGCTVKKWNSLRKNLIAMGKIEARGEFLGNYRADKELETLGKLSEKQRENRARPNKINELQSPRFDQPEPEPDTEYGGGVAREREGFHARLAELAGSEIANVAGLAEADRWLALPGIDADAAIGSVSEQVAAAAEPPRSMAYFTPAIRRLSALISAPELTPVSASAPATPPKPKRDMDAMMRAALERLSEGSDAR